MNTARDPRVDVALTLGGIAMRGLIYFGYALAGVLVLVSLSRLG